MTHGVLLHGIAAALIALAGGCDLAFGLGERPIESDAAPDPMSDAAPYSPCGAFLGDDPLRYASISNPKFEPDPDGGTVPLPWSWDEARTMCRRRGMDLAVFNDLHELGMATEPPGWPYWIGEQIVDSTWSSVDGCPALMTGETTSTAAGCGVVRGPVEISPTACSGMLPPPSEPGVVIAALCESPRPTDASCLGNDPLQASYVRSAEPMSYEATRTYCAGIGGDVVVLETHAEWLHVAELTTEVIEARFWIGSTFDGEVWTTSTGCPAVYSWTGGSPGTPAAGSCLASVVRQSTAEEDLGAIIVDGVEPTACAESAEVFAVCEVREVR